MNNKLTSIIIPTKNNIQFTERCILSIINNTDVKQTPYEIILLDDGSTDGTKELAELYKNQVRFYDSSEYTKFGSKNNYGVSLAKGEYIWCLNNDIELLNDNLTPMIESLKNKDIGIVGSLHLFPNGAVNHLGIAFNDKLHPEHFFPHSDPSDWGIVKSRFVEAVTGASFLIKKSTFNLVGGFDENYSWGYEDIDLCLKLKEKGLKSYCNVEAKMIHFGQSTRKDYTDIDLQNDTNFQYFLSKWQNKIKPNIHTYKIKHKNKSKTDLPETEENSTEDSEPKRIYLYKSKKFSAFSLLSEKLEPHIDEPYELIDRLDNLQKIEGKKFLISTTHFFPEYLESAPDNFVELRSFDVNYERKNYVGNDYWTESLKKTNKIILASTEYCKDFLVKSGVDEKKIHVVPHGYNDELIKYDFEEIQFDTVNILMIINTNDPIRYGYEKLVRALELIKQDNPNQLSKINLILKNYGSKESSVVFKKTELPILQKLGVKFEYSDTFLSEKDLAKLYYKANLFIAPFRGEGFGMKILDAAVAGMPIISPFYGGPKDYLKDCEHIPLDYKLINIQEGIDYVSLFLNDDYYWADVDESSLADKLNYAINNIEKLFNKAQKKRDYLRENYSHKAKWNRIKQIINELDTKDDTSKFELYDAEISNEIKTSAYLKAKEFKQSYIINTNKPNNFRNTLEHLLKIYPKEFFANIETIIVDDASDQDVTDLLKDFDSIPIKYLKYTKWGGSGFAREVGLKHASADNMIISGDDIKPMKGFFEKHYDFFLNNPKPYLLVGHVEWDTHIRNSMIANFTTKISNFQFGFEEIRNEKKIDYKHCYTPNVSFRKSDIINSRTHFKIGMILFEDTIWSKELMDKGFEIHYDRTLYALHNHQFKTDMLQWFIDRTKEISNYIIISYTSNSQFDEFLGLSDILPNLNGIYGRYPLAELEKLAPLFDENISNIVSSIENMQNFENENGFLKDVRDSFNEQMTSLNVLYMVFGLAKNINTSNSEDIAKGVSFLYYQNWLNRRVQKENTFGNLGMKESLRLVIFFGRKRLPIIFEPIYRLGKFLKLRLRVKF